MFRICVCCGGGLSSSFLAKNLTKGIKEAGLESEVEIEFRPFSDSHDVADSFDVLMLCPHLRYQIAGYLEKHDTNLPNTALYVIPAQMYGLMEIKEMYRDALDIYEIFKKEGGHPTHFPNEEQASLIKRNKAYYHVYKKD